MGPIRMDGVSRVWSAYRRRGLGYVCYKILKRTLQDHPFWGRRLLYRSPRWYWEQRGGQDYFEEQEGQPERSLRSGYIARRIALYEPGSILEIGCGYGKQLAALRRRLDVPLTGLDWSLAQLGMATEYLGPARGIRLLRGDGARLPFADKSFELVLTSAVILHNPPVQAESILGEVCRVARRFAVHNEDTNTSFSRYGYDIASWYRKRGFRVVESGPIPELADSALTQFSVIDMTNHGA